jgi:pilus assembly protein CpaE
MSRIIVIWPAGEARNSLAETLRAHPSVDFVKLLDAFPSKDAIRRLMRIHSPNVVLVDMADPGAASLLSQVLHSEFKGIHYIGLTEVQDENMLRKGMRMGMRDLLTVPLDPQEVDPLLASIAADVECNPVEPVTPNGLLAFFPAKPGVGASTIASNTAWVLSEKEGIRVLLADCDPYSGVLGFQFKVESGYTLSDAALQSHQLDDQMWATLVQQVGKLELLTSGGPLLSSELNELKVGRLLEFAKQRYDFVCADLPGTFDDLSVKALRESRQIFLITTPEMASLRLARTKARLLETLDLGDCVSLVVNRFSRRCKLTIDEIQNLVGLPVAANFPCDYAAVNMAMWKGGPVKELKPSVERLINEFVHVKSRQPKKARFVDFFATTPLLYGFRKTRAVSTTVL